MGSPSLSLTLPVTLILAVPRRSDTGEAGTGDVEGLGDADGVVLEGAGPGPEPEQAPTSNPAATTAGSRRVRMARAS